MQVHLLSFEGPDPYSRVGGLATRIEGLSRALAALGHEVHLWFVGDPERPRDEEWEGVHLHRWCQWMHRPRSSGLYEDDYDTQAELAASLPPYLVREVLAPHVRAGGRAVVLAEEWQTAQTVLHLHWLLRYESARDGVQILWNANNTFGFDRVAWKRLSRVATLTTVSRYMKHRMREQGVEAVVIPNGLASDAFEPPEPAAVSALRERFVRRLVVAKMARWDPDKRWLGAIETVAELKRRQRAPVLLARGGSEPHGREVLEAASARGLRVVDRSWTPSGPRELLATLEQVGGDADVVNLISQVDPQSRRVLLQGADAVLANSRHEPFGLVGLETMAVGGIACTGSTGEDYAVPGHNALVLESGEPREFIALFDRLRSDFNADRALRRAARATAAQYAWPAVIDRVLLARLAIARDPIAT